MDEASVSSDFEKDKENRIIFEEVEEEPLKSPYSQLSDKVFPSQSIDSTDTAQYSTVPDLNRQASPPLRPEEELDFDKAWSGMPEKRQTFDYGQAPEAKKPYTPMRAGTFDSPTVDRHVILTRAESPDEINMPKMPRMPLKPESMVDSLDSSASEPFEYNSGPIPVGKKAPDTPEFSSDRAETPEAVSPYSDTPQTAFYNRAPVVSKSQTFDHPDEKNAADAAFNFEPIMVLGPNADLYLTRYDDVLIGDVFSSEIAASRKSVSGGQMNIIA